MPLPNEHAARIVEPSKFKEGSFRRVNDKFGDGIHAIFGKLKGEDSMTLQAIHFDAKKYTVAEAKKWLKDNDYKPIEFEPATEERSDKMKQGIFMRELTAESKDAVIDIVGVIGWEVWYPAMREMLRQIPATVERVIFDIYSPGGDVWEGNAIIQEIGALKQKTVAHVQVAGSMATLIAVACKEREIASNGRFLIHNPWTATMGDAEEFEKRAKELRDCEREAVLFYSERTGKPENEIKALMDEERWLTPEETLAFGFVQKINDPFDAKEYEAVKAEIVAAGKWPKALAEIPDKNKTEESIKTEEVMEGKKNDDANTTGAEGKVADAADAPDKSADADAGKDGQGKIEMSADERSAYERGFAEGKTEAEAVYAKQVTAAAESAAKIKKDNAELDGLQRRMQGERDSARAQVEKLSAALAEATGKIERLLSGGMSFAPSIETWADALKACNGEYETARKQYPDLFREERERAKANRK